MVSYRYELRNERSNANHGWLETAQWHGSAMSQAVSSDRKMLTPFELYHWIPCLGIWNPRTMLSCTPALVTISLGESSSANWFYVDRNSPEYLQTPLLLLAMWKIWLSGSVAGGGMFHGSRICVLYAHNWFMSYASRSCTCGCVWWTLKVFSLSVIHNAFNNTPVTRTEPTWPHPETWTHIVLLSDTTISTHL